MAQKTKELAEALGLERLSKWGAAEGAYERWLAEEGVPVLFVYEELPPVTKDPATGLPSFDLGRSPLSPTDPEHKSFYRPDYDHAFVPPWVNVLGHTHRGQRLVDAIRAALRDEPMAEALAAAYALGGQRAVEALLLRDREAA